jgi:sulfur-carrier protein
VSEGRVTVQLPRLLAELLGGESRIAVEGDSLGSALDDLVRQRPALRLHLFDESGALRRHILCHCNDAQTRTRLDLPVRPGDTITLLHSLAGG